MFDHIWFNYFVCSDTLVLEYVPQINFDSNVVCPAKSSFAGQQAVRLQARGWKATLRAGSRRLAGGAGPDGRDAVP